MTTYTIHRDNKRFNAKRFDSYEQARSYIRKWVRKNLGTDESDYSANEYRNPEISRYGFSVKRVEV